MASDPPSSRQPKGSGSKAKEPAAAPAQFPIGDLCREFGLTPRTLRHYEDLELLAPVRKGQLRVYPSHQRDKLKIILNLRAVGVPLADVNRYIVATTSSYKLKIAASDLQALLTRQRDAQNNIQNAIELLLSWEVKIKNQEPLV